MGAKMAASFADIFMAEIETKLIHQSEIKPREWKRYVVTFSSIGIAIKKR